MIPPKNIEVHPNMEDKLINSFTDWKNEPTFDDLYSDYTNAKPFHDEYVEKLRDWSEAFDGGYDKVLDKTKSNYKSNLIRKQSEWSYPSLEEPILNAPNIFSVKSNVLEGEDNELVHNQLLNYQWNNLVPKVTIVNQASRNMVNEGTAIIKSVWSFEYEETEEEKEIAVYAESEEEIVTALQEIAITNEIPQSILEEIVSGKKRIQVGSKKEQVTQLKVIKNRPEYIVVDNESLIVDASCKGISDNIKFVVEVMETNFSNLEKNAYRKITNEEGENVTVGHYHNLAGIKRLALKEIDTLKLQGQNQTDVSEFDFNDISRKIITMYEYWGYWDINGDGILKPIVASWVDKTLIRLELNPYPHRQIPYSFAPFMPVKGSIHGEPNGALLKNDQRAITNIRRGIDDISNRSYIGQEFINENLFYDSVQKKNYKEGRTVYHFGSTDPATSIYRRKPEEIPNSLLTVLGMHKTDAEQLTGVAAYNTGGNTKKGSGISTNLTETDATTKRDMGILRRFTSLFADLGSKTLAMNQSYVPEGYVYRVTGAKKLQSILPNTLDGSFLASVTIATPERNDNIANKILTLMQTNAAQMQPEMAAIHYTTIARLWNQEGLADEIEALSEPKEPSSEEVEMRQLAIERERIALKLEKMKLLEAANRIKVDATRYSEEAIQALSSSKLAEADKSTAQAEKLNAQTLLFNQEIDYINTGLKRKEFVEDKEYEHARNLETEEKRTKREKDNIVAKEQKSNQEQSNYAIEKSKDIIGTTLNNQVIDGTDAEYNSIRDNNTVDIIEEIQKI